jgi:hypothetical protein
MTARRLSTAFLVAWLSLYAPFAWLLVINYPWPGGYRLFWLRLWPILPGFVPGAWLFHPNDRLEFLTMAIVTGLLLCGLTWLGTRGRTGLVAAAVLGLLVSVPSSFLAYAAFRA